MSATTVDDGANKVVDLDEQVRDNALSAVMSLITAHTALKLALTVTEGHLNFYRREALHYRSAAKRVAGLLGVDQDELGIDPCPIVAEVQKLIADVDLRNALTEDALSANPAVWPLDESDAKYIEDYPEYKDSKAAQRMCEIVARIRHGIERSQEPFAARSKRERRDAIVRDSDIRTVARFTLTQNGAMSETPEAQAARRLLGKPETVDG